MKIIITEIVIKYRAVAFMGIPPAIDLLFTFYLKEGKYAMIRFCKTHIFIVGSTQK